MAEKIKRQEQALSGESREPLVIKRVYQFTHPDYDSTWAGEGRSRGKHLELRRKWGNAIDAIAADPEAILFYTSAFGFSEFQSHARVKKGDPKGMSLWDMQSEKMAGRAIDRDLSRILYAKKKMGDRFILLTERKFTSKERAGGLEVWRKLIKDNFEREQKRLAAILKNKNIEIPAQPILCFGEYKELCVQYKGEELAKLLGMVEETESHKATRLVSVMPELSLSSEDPASFRKTPL